MKKKTKRKQSVAHYKKILNPAPVEFKAGRAICADTLFSQRTVCIEMSLGNEIIEDTLTAHHGPVVLELILGGKKVRFQRI